MIGFASRWMQRHSTIWTRPNTPTAPIAVRFIKHLITPISLGWLSACLGQAITHGASCKTDTSTPCYSHIKTEGTNPAFGRVKNILFLPRTTVFTNVAPDTFVGITTNELVNAVKSVIKGSMRTPGTKNRRTRRQRNSAILSAFCAYPSLAKASLRPSGENSPISPTLAVLTQNLHVQTRRLSST